MEGGMVNKKIKNKTKIYIWVSKWIKKDFANWMKCLTSVFYNIKS